MGGGAPGGRPGSARAPRPRRPILAVSPASGMGSSTRSIPDWLTSRWRSGLHLVSTSREWGRRLLAVSSTPSDLLFCSPNGIRTRVFTLRGGPVPRQSPLQSAEVLVRASSSPLESARTAGFRVVSVATPVADRALRRRQNAGQHGVAGTRKHAGLGCRCTPCATPLRRPHRVEERAKLVSFGAPAAPRRRAPSGARTFAHAAETVPDLRPVRTCDRPPWPLQTVPSGARPRGR
jgi:hypothetical protein